MVSYLRIMCWNIAEGRNDGLFPEDGALPRIAENIRAKSPDIVLLNELHNKRGWPFGNGVNQVVEIANMAYLPYYHWGNAAKTGWTGFKAVAVLSRCPLHSPRVHPVMRGSGETRYATLETRVNIYGVWHHIFSTRFDAYDPVDRSAGIRQAVNLLRNLDPGAPVIFGGDFNAEPNTPEVQNFVANSGLKDVYLERPDPGICADDVTSPRKDYVFYRGPYQVNAMEQRCPWAKDPETTELSDHPWIFVELLFQAPPLPPGLALRVQPYPVPVEVPTQVIVEAKDPATQSPVAGTVEIDGQAVSNTNTAFAYTFKKRTVRYYDEELGKVVRETEYPYGSVKAPSYQETDINFGFPRRRT